MERANRSETQKSKYRQSHSKHKQYSKAESHKQYIGSKDTGQGFADKRKRKAKFEYIKLLQKEKKRSEVTGNKTSQHKSLKEFFNQEGHKESKVHSFWSAEKIAKSRQKKKQEEKESHQAVQVEKGKALEAYQSKKKAHHLKLCKRTRKGQPVMKLQMEVLLDKIQKQKGNG